MITVLLGARVRFNFFNFHEMNYINVKENDFNFYLFIWNVQTYIMLFVSNVENILEFGFGIYYISCPPVVI